MFLFVLRFLMQRVPKSGSNGATSRPSDAKRLPPVVQMEPKVAKVSPNALLMVLKLVQNRPNYPPGCLCGAKVVPKSPPRVPKRRLSSAQAPPASPKWSHEGPKAAKIASQERPKAPQSAKPSQISLLKSREVSNSSQVRLVRRLICWGAA